MIDYLKISILALILILPFDIAFAKVKSNKKITKITFSENDKSSKKRKPTSIEKAIKASEKKKLVGMNYDVKNPNGFSFDPASEERPTKKKIVTAMPNKKPVPEDPSVNNPVVVGSRVPLAPKKSDAELVTEFQKTADVVLREEFSDESL